MGLDNVPRIHIPAKLRMENKATRHPAMVQERIKVIAKSNRFQGKAADFVIHKAQFIDFGARDCTNFSAVTSPGKYAYRQVANMANTATNNRISSTTSFFRITDSLLLPQ
jgi:hypothetical protein